MTFDSRRYENQVSKLLSPHLEQTTYNYGNIYVYFFGFYSKYFVCLAFFWIASYSEVIFAKHCKWKKITFLNACVPLSFPFPETMWWVAQYHLQVEQEPKKVLSIQLKCFTVSLSCLVS